MKNDLSRVALDRPENRTLELLTLLYNQPTMVLGQRATEGAEPGGETMDTVYFLSILAEENFAIRCAHGADSATYRTALARYSAYLNGFAAIERRA